MKTKAYAQTILIIIFSTLTFYSCNRVLDDVENLSQFPPDKVWSSETLTNAYLANLYGSFIPGWPTSSGSSADEAGPGVLAADAITTQNGSFGSWPYANIRKINILLDEIGDGTLDEDYRNQVIGQALFLRAWLYFDMLIRHGGVPIITEVQDLSDDLLVSRNSSLECFEFIEGDLAKALTLLPDKYIGADFGKIDKAIVHAFRSRVALYKASPLFNPDAPYSNSYWQEAYDVTLEAKNFLDANGYGLIENYGDLFSVERHKEAILVNQYSNPIKTNNRDQCVRPLSESKGCTGQEQPIWSMVESYPMADGKAPGNSTKYDYDVQTFWENRDPRFYSTIVYNGDIFELSGKKDRRQYTDFTLVAYQIADEQDVFGDKQQHGRTGFYIRKGLEVDLPSEEVGTNDLDWIEIRYAEILFNLAEAAFALGKSEEAVGYLIQIRQRAGIEPGSDNRYGIPAGIEGDELIDLIFNDKKIEFAFEGKRIDDLRRSRRWHLLDGLVKHGLEATLKPQFIDADGDLTKYLLLPQDFNYEVREVINDIRVMVIPENYYFIPLLMSDLEVNPNLEQNVGWDGGTFDPTL